MAPRRSLCLIALCACNGIAGLTDMSFEGAANSGAGGAVSAGGGGAGASSSSSGGGTGGSSSGTGGSSPTNHAADWTSSLDSVWLFDLASPELGRDSGSQGVDLTEIGLPQRDVDNMVQGVSSLKLLTADVLATNASQLNVDPAASFTLGGWFNTSMSTSAKLMGRKDGVGYLVEYLGGSQGAKCFWEDDTAIFLAGVADGSWLPNQWVHFVCRYDAASGGELTPFIHGVAGPARPATFAPAATPFEIGGSSPSYEGSADEAFFVHKALSNATIARIHACGIDGSGCTCLDSEPTQYDDCGNADPNCGVLPACNLAAP